MSRGDLAVFNAFKKKMADGTHDLDTNVFKVALISEQVGGTPEIAVDDVDPDLLAYTEVSGGTYVALTVTVTWTESAGVVTFQVTSGASQWAQDGSGPLDIKTALIYDDTSTDDKAVAFIDMTADGTTAVSTQNGDITINWEPDIFTLT